MKGDGESMREGGGEVLSLEGFKVKKERMCQCVRDYARECV
jgi:hypothetical protein